MHFIFNLFFYFQNFSSFFLGMTGKHFVNQIQVEREEKKHHIKIVLNWPLPLTKKNHQHEEFEFLTFWFSLRLLCLAI